MQPVIAQALAEVKISELHREAARRRVAREARPRQPTLVAAREVWASAKTAAAGRLAAGRAVARGSSTSA